MIDLFANLASLQRSLDYHLSRHSLLASNVANAETPGYQPLDASFDAYLTRVNAIETTDPAHLGAADSDSFKTSIFVDASISQGNDENGVSLEREMAKMSANSLRYKAVAEIFSRRLGLIRYAATDGKQ